ncbi:MAG: FapA family protein [Oscillospiraceae bacterium]|nr:FapA family protein [Oscillospiraceae bacterium]
MNIINNISSSLVDEQAELSIDAVIHVSISANKLEAYVNIEPPMNGGATPTLKALEDELVRYSITYGIDEIKLRDISENPKYNYNIVIARGVAEIRGIDGTFELKFNTEKDFKPKQRSDGTVDFLDLDIVENVKKGQVLCEITLPTDGTEGTTVTGAKILPIKGKAVPCFSGKNTELNEQGTAISATIDGQVEYIGGKINVSETFYIQENVDISTGNIKVNGNIVIKGMVLAGFVVEAGGNIEIKGTVESAKIIAGGNVILKSGITGSELICAGDLTGRFIESCDFTVKGSAKSDYIINSTFRCGKDLRIVGSLARLSGGSCLVGGDLIAPIIGSESGMRTEIELGTDPYIIDRQEEITNQLPCLEKQVNSLTRLISLLQQYKAANRLTPDKKEALESALYSYETKMALIESAEKELVEINESIETKGYGKIICTGTVYPGTKLKIGNATMTVTAELKHEMLYNNKGEICRSSIR